MPKYMAVHVVVLAGLVLAVTFLVFQSRALTIKVDRLEAARDRQASEVRDAGQAKQPAETSGGFELKTDPTDRGAPSTPPPEETPTKPEGPTPMIPSETAAELTPAQEQAVAKAVDRILKEKYGHIPKPMKPEELEKMLDQELKLSDSQKVRIGEILKWKRDEQNKLFEGEDPLSGPTMKKAMAIERKAETAIKSELDATQQAKYEQLKKDGKLPQGVMIQVEAGGKDGE
jgi:hypothetical protein